MNSFVVGSDKAFFDSLPKMQQYSFFSDCAKFFEERYGEENVISAVVHLDETTPHMQLNLIPITPTEDYVARTYLTSLNFNNFKRTSMKQLERNTDCNVEKKEVKQNTYPPPNTKPRRL